LGHILSAFRIAPEGEGRTGQLEAFEDYLFDQLNRGRRVLLIMDEAQNLPRETLEELRMLSNIDYDGTPLFQVFLVGQPEFREAMSAPNMEQLKQRVIASYHLENLTREETQEYILHRLAVAGWSEDPVFTADGIDAIFVETEGRPRRINTLCTRLMLYCALERRHEVNACAVETVVSEMHEEQAGDAECNSQMTEEADQHTPSGGAAVPIERALSKVKAPKVMKAPAADGPGNMFDRLRAKRSAPQPATLEDVASAIAAANADEKLNNGAGDADAFDAASLPDDTASPKGKGGWRKTVARSIDEARGELKQAHASMQRVRSTLDEADDKRDENRETISASLSRAETLLDEIRSALR
ncbi:MAG: AAA family ATPase, partial [Alphaproteobacteria bacterium]|nr:AAA family ATPase [Alphaproteobacteria bacterium]